MRIREYVIVISAVCFGMMAGCTVLMPQKCGKTINVEDVLKKPFGKLSKRDLAILTRHAFTNLIDVTDGDVVTGQWQFLFKKFAGHDGELPGFELLVGETQWTCFFEDVECFTGHHIIKCEFVYQNNNDSEVRYVLTYETNSVQCASFFCYGLGGGDLYSKYKYDKVPKYTSNNEEAIARAKIIAKKFGIDNFGDSDKWRIYYIGGDGNYGYVSVFASKIINGYPSFCNVTVEYFDSQDIIIRLFSNLNNSYDIATLPTNAVVSRGEAKSLADVYIRKYYDDQALVPGMRFVTNRLEYVRPNYNYIHPGNFGGLKKRPLYPPRLAWLCEYKKPDHYPNGFPNSYHAFPLVIYVDAVNGKMLGGHD